MCRGILFSLLAVFAGAGCSSPYRADYEPDHDFSKYESYQWLEPNVPPMDALAGNPIIKRRVTRAVDRVLREKGYRLIDGNEPDFRIHVHGTIQERMRVNEGVGVTGYYGRYGAMDLRHVDVSYYEEGTVILDVIDRARNQLVWRGWVTEIFREYRDPRQAEAAVDRAVRGILGNFPPPVH